MKLFGIETNGLLISVGITIIMCGAVSYYCHMRVKNVEVALMKQNQVLTSFITNVQTEIRKGALSDTKIDVSSPEARYAVKNIENSKIEVSDDDASQSDSDSCSDSDSGSDSGSGSDTSETDTSETEIDDTEEESGNNIKIKINKNDINKNDIKFVDIHVNTNSKIIELSDLEEITDLSNLHNESDDDSDDESMSDVISVGVSDVISVGDVISMSDVISVGDVISIKHPEPELKKINLSEIIVDTKEEEQINNLIIKEDLGVDETNILIEVNLDLDPDSSNNFIKKIVKTEDKEKEKNTNINKMKIDELREKAILSGLGTVESLKKLKKSDLITLLTNKE